MPATIPDIPIIMSNNFLKVAWVMYLIRGKERNIPMETAGTPTSTYGKSSLVYNPAEACIIQVISEIKKMPSPRVTNDFWALQPA